MPSFTMYRNLYGGMTNGEAKHKEAQDLMTWSWDDDVASQTVYLYDWFHDRESYDKFKLTNLSPQHDNQKIPLEVKFLTNSLQSFNEDPITYHIQLKPHQTCNVPYYKNRFGIYDATFPIGLYCDIKDSEGRYNRWLVVGIANYYDSMFPTFNVLPCDKLFQWVAIGRKFEMVGVLRSQNSYNSGEWSNQKITWIEDQQKFILPLNKATEYLYYNQRFIIDNLGISTEPRTWKVSKVNRINNNGTVLITLAQDMFNEHTDYIEKDANGNTIGMWADYFTYNVKPEHIDTYDKVSVRIKYSGVQNSQLKVGGNYRTFSAEFFDKDNNPTDYKQGTWSVLVNGEVRNDLIDMKTVDKDIKVKFLGNDECIGYTVTVKYTTDDDIVSSVNMNVSGL